MLQFENKLPPLWNERSWSWLLLLVIAVIALQFCNSFDLFPLSLGSYWKDKRVVSAVTARAARTRTALPRKVDHRLPIPRPTLAFSSLCARTHTRVRSSIVHVCVCARAHDTRLGYLHRLRTVPFDVTLSFYYNETLFSMFVTSLCRIQDVI